MEVKKNSLASHIAIGTQGHFSIGHLSQEGNFGGGVYRLAVIANGAIDSATGMIMDFAVLKRAVSSVLDNWIEHGFVVPEWLQVVTRKCRREWLDILSTPDWSLDTLPLTLFDRLLGAIREPGHLRNIFLERIWERKQRVENTKGTVITSVVKKPKKGTYFEHTIVFAHRIVNLGKCNNPHSHSWTPKMIFNRELSSDEYGRIANKIKTYFEENWKWKWVFQASDDVWAFFKKQKVNVKLLPSPPTTEIISVAMIQDIEAILHTEGSDIRLAHFELWETPTNFATT